MPGLEAILDRSAPSWTSLFWKEPFVTLAKTLYTHRITQSPAQHPQPAVIVCISDTHNSQPVLPPGDVLIHAGDLTQGGSYDELQTTLTWLDRQAHEHVIVIAGNHDVLLDVAYQDTPKDSNERRSLQWGRIIYLCDSAIDLRLSSGRILNLYGTPWTRKHGNWAFQFRPHSGDAEKHFRRIPLNTDVLVTHMPPRFHLDCDGFGDDVLLSCVREVRPKLHVFGHVHEGYGREELRYDAFENRYERVCRGDGGAFDILCMVWGCLFDDKARNIAHTTLVNAAAVGGLRDDKRREPVVVEL